MPARDVYHSAVVNALQKEGWTITHDPYTLTVGRRDLFVDLGAEKPIAAEREGRRIAVEIKSFLGPSDMRELEVAVGQYMLYRSILSRVEPDRQIYLAVTDVAFANVWSEPIARPVMDDARILLLVFNAAEEVIVQWTP